MSKPSTDPTRAELEILQVLWRSGPLSVRQVWEAMGRKGSYTTVLKLLQIMLVKKWVKRDASSLSHIYEAAIAEAANQERMVGGLLDRAFGGSIAQLLLRALSAKAASEDELKKIRSLLAEAEAKQPKNSKTKKPRP